MATIIGQPTDDFIFDDGITNDVIKGNGGNDTIIVSGGNDTVLAGSGNDTLFSGDGNDLIYGGSGNDVINAGAGNNTVFGGDGNDQILAGGSGNDFIGTNGGSDIITYSEKVIGSDTITDFDVAHDTIDLRALTGLSLDQLDFDPSNGGTLIHAKDPSLMSGSIFLTGVDPSTLTKDNVLTAAACFLRGTLVATPDGERAVETLAIGDIVTTLDGVARPVKWIGRRSFKRRFIGAGSEANPVVFRAGSLGGDLPHRDLAVSGKHAMFFEGVFVRAEDLVNGTTITRDSVCELVEYFHVELETPDVIFANGCATETYANHNSRRMFANWQEYVDLYGAEDAVEPNADGEFDRAYPLVTEGAALEAIAARFAPAEPVRRAA